MKKLTKLLCKIGLHSPSYWYDEENAWHKQCLRCGNHEKMYEIEDSRYTGKWIVLVLILIASSINLHAQSPKQGNARIAYVTNAKFKKGDMVRVKDRKNGYRYYTLTTEGFRRNGKKQVMYNCVDASGRQWYYLPEIGLIKNSGFSLIDTASAHLFSSPNFIMVGTITHKNIYSLYVSTSKNPLVTVTPYSGGEESFSNPIDSVIVHFKKSASHWLNDSTLVIVKQ